VIVRQHMEMIKDLLSKEVRLVEQDDGMDAFAAELFDVGADGVEDACGGGFGFESPVAGFGKSPSQRAQRACFTDARLSGSGGRVVVCR
jgi:hypothetical protein